MTPGDLERYLHEHIPLSEAMGIKVRAATSDRIELTAPLAPNINHRATVFGGSASAAAILAAWSLLHLRLGAAGTGGRIVIHANTMKYLLPIRGEFRSIAEAPASEDWQKLLKALKRNRMARISVRSRLEYEGASAGEFEGEFVVLPQPAPPYA